MISITHIARRLLLTAPLLVASLTQGQGLFDGYMNHADMQQRVRALGAAHPFCRVESIGTSREGRDLPLLILSTDPDTAHERPAILITAGLDGRHFVGTETAVRVAERLARDHAELLEAVTIYIIPRVNPDAAERNLGPLNMGLIGTLRPVDSDRDRETDEDGPVDLNGDGVITLMRRLNPPLSDPPTHLPDPAEPRLLKRADAAKGEAPIWTVYTEGLDQDGDGLIAEDGPGGVDLDRNFMHGWPEYASDAGPHQLSEPESLALARFVLKRSNIMMAITYGRHDNMVNAPDGRATDITGRAPRELDAGDVELYKELARIFKETTGQTRAPKENVAGSFHAWLYAQRGLPSIATVVWGRPDPSPAPIIEGEEPAKEDRNAPKPADAEEAGWLLYSDRDRAGRGFVEWTPFDHPTLGRVEIGGFVPGFQLNPPAAELDDLADKQALFLVELARYRPRLRQEGPEVTRLAEGLYEVRLAIINDGRMPTTTAIARKARAVPPTVVRLHLPLSDIAAGSPVSQSWGIDGSGGRSDHRWIIRASAGARISIEIVNVQHGSRAVMFETN